MTNLGFIHNKTEMLKNENELLVPIEFTHSVAIGQTGCGKTTSYIYPNLEYRIKNNHSILFYDFKGKEHQTVKYFAQKYLKLNNVIEIGKPWSKSVNILKYMTKKNLEDMFIKMFGNEKENMFWARSSANVCVKILDILKSTNYLKNFALNCNDDKEMINAYIKENSKSHFQSEYTLTNLSTIVNSLENLMNFFESLDDIYELYDNLLNFIIYHNYKNEVECIEYINELNILKEKIVFARNTLKSLFPSSSKTTSSTLDSLLICINAPLMNLVDNKSLNCDELDIIKALKDGIVIIDTNSFPDIILSVFNDSIFKELEKRSKLNNIKPVSVFIDEAQKVLSKNFELPIDVLRESKVELFLAFQNKELVINSLGLVKFEALYKNIKRRYLFKNPEDNDNFDLTSLGTFEYYIDDLNKMEKVKSQPRFINKDLLFKAEQNFQKKEQLNKKFITVKTLKNSILVFDHSLMLDNLVVLRDIKGKEIISKIYDEENYTKLIETVNNRFKKAKTIKDINNFTIEFDEDDIEYESVDLTKLCDTLAMFCEDEDIVMDIPEYED